MDKKGITLAIKQREAEQSACHHEFHILPPAYHGGPTTKRCSICEKYILVKEV